jgi:hypothetical protein
VTGRQGILTSTRPTSDVSRDHCLGLHFLNELRMNLIIVCYGLYFIYTLLRRNLIQTGIILVERFISFFFFFFFEFSEIEDEVMYNIIIEEKTENEVSTWDMKAKAEQCNAAHDAHLFPVDEACYL